jgi:hypothetical protein
MNIDTIGKTVQVMSVMAGVVLSVLSFNDTRNKEAEARQLEAQKPYFELRQKLYVEVVKSAAVLANSDDHTKEEIVAARRRFRELYVAELSMVEVPQVEGKMVKLAEKIDPKLIPLNPAQKTAYDLSHALRDSFAEDWKGKQK